MQIKEVLTILIKSYDYARAYDIAKQDRQLSQNFKQLLFIMKERRELNIQPLKDVEFQVLKERVALDFSCPIQVNPVFADEQMANYLMDLEAKLQSHQLIDFVRAISPIIYRLFVRLIRTQIPDLDTFVKNNQDGQYDTWRFDIMKNSDNQVLRNFKSDPRVTSSTLLQLILSLEIEPSLKTACQQLRNLEKSTRNPLAHLIQSFDENRLAADTGFSSQALLQILVELTHRVGIIYPRQPFYFDQMNAVLLQILEEK